MMNTTTERGVAATDQVGQAQSEVDAHVTSGVDGRCHTCGMNTPCPAYERALMVFSQFGRLPQRRPGLTRCPVPPSREGEV